jgi:uncharacterized membrane protein
MQASPSRGKWLKIAFGVSLAVNLFLIGLIGGQVMGGDDEAVKRANATRGYSLHPRVMMEALPEERHDDIRAFYADARKGMGRKWRGINTIRREIDAALRADPFDIDAFRSAQQREVDARGALRGENNDVIAAFLATLSHEERTTIADLALSRLEEQTKYWRERRTRREAEAQ